MKKCIVAILLLSASLVSCEQQGGDGLSGNFPDVTFILESDMESSVYQDGFVFESAWTVEDVPEWCSIEPTGGDAGSVGFRLTANSRNTDLKEREGTIKISIEGSGTVEMWVVQRGTDGVRFLQDSMYATGEGGEVSVNIEGNVAIAPESVVSDVDWAVLSDVEYSDSTVLGDGRTKSLYYTGKMIFNLSANVESDPREVSMSVGDQNVSVLQVGTFNDWDKGFFRRSVMQRFTATWCGYCPAMGEAFDQAEEDIPGRYVPINMHPTNSDASLAWSETGYFEQLYSVSGYPTAVVNGVACLYNELTVAVIAKKMVALAEEAAEDFPSSTNIMAFSSLNDGVINLNVFVAMKEKRDYKIGIVLMEDGIETSQAGFTGTYMHEHIARAMLTDDGGDPVQCEAGQSVALLTYSYGLPSNVAGPENLSLAIYISESGSEEGALPGIVYLDSGLFVDNAAVLPVNGSVDYKFE